MSVSQLQYIFSFRSDLRAVFRNRDIRGNDREDRIDEKSGCSPQMPFDKRQEYRRLISNAINSDYRSYLQPLSKSTI